jgi:hypothetical protein
MNLHNVAAGVFATMMGVSSLAVASPGGHAVVTKQKTTLAVVNLGAEVGGSSYSMTAKNFDDADGVMQGEISVQRFGFDPSTGGFSFSFITCAGPAFANTVTVDKSSGASSVNAVLNPAAPGCFGFNTTTLVVAISGLPTGGFSRSDTGTTILKFVGSTEKASFQSDSFDESFSGSIGYYTGAFSGNAESAKITNRTRVN